MNKPINGNNERILAIDDCRECSYAQVLARTYKDGIAALTHMGPWDVLCLDHDLGNIERHYTETGRELTGYDVLMFLVENPQYKPGKVEIISSNPSGIERMKAVLRELYPSEEQE